MAPPPPPPFAVPTFPLAGGGSMPAMMMGTPAFDSWFRATAPGRGVQTFYSYHNAQQIAPELRAAGRETVFVSTGIPCGCCAMDAPRVEPMNAQVATQYIDEELADLGTNYVDLLLFHHRCRTPEETASVWQAFEAAKRAGKARHIGVSNFNKHDLATLMTTAQEPIEVLEAHFGVGMMDFEVLDFANASNIHAVGFASISELSTDHPTIHPTLTRVADAHGISTVQTIYAYNHHKGLTVLSSCSHPENPAKCADYYAKDLAIFNVQLSNEEVAALDAVTVGKRTCTDCFTFECQACAKKLQQLGCPIENRPFPVWGRANARGTECQACAALPQNAAAVMDACGRTDLGESLETMVPKACGI